MAPNRRPGPGGGDAADSGGKAVPRVQQPGPTGIDLRLPTLEVFAMQHGSFLSTRGRPLSQRELKLARPVFGDALNYAEIRVVVSPIANAPVTLGSFVRVANQRAPGAREIDDATLIHELTHVWQFQTRGMRYVTNSLCHQVVGTITSGSRNAAYRVTRADVLEARSIHRLPAEKQASLVEMWFDERFFYRDNSEEPVRVRSEPLVDKMLDEVRAGRPLPKSYILHEAAYGPGANTLQRPDPLHPDPPPIPWLRLEF